MRVYLNCGHGVGRDGRSYDSGAVGPSGLREEVVTRKIVARTAAYLREAGFEVRSDDAARVSFLQARKDAIAWKADALVSVHCNAATDPAARGVETLYRVSCAWRLAEEIQEAIVEGVTHGSLHYAVKDRGAKQRKDLGILATGAMPSALVECLFISNPTEEAMLANPDAQNSLAWCIAEGVKAWRAGR